MFLMRTRTAWSDYFTGSPTNYKTQTYDSKLTSSNTNVHVSNCLFRSISSSGDGGALCCTSVTLLLVESSSFFSCKTSGSWGGAIYFSNSNSGAQSVLYGLCGYDCNPNLHCQFAYVRVNSVASNKNYVNYSSVSRCVNQNSGTYHTLRQHSGKISCLSINLSMNKCSYRSGTYSDPTLDSSYATCSFSFCTLADNIATVYNCIDFASGGAKYEMKSCNILRNTQGTLDSEGTIRTTGNAMIEDSCILENRATNIFYVTSSSYAFTLSKCTVDSTSNNGYLTIQNTISKSFIHALNHMSTQNCHSQYDSVGNLPLIISLSEKQINCYTCRNFFYQPQLTLASTFIFILNFIHPGSSNYP
jgi:hypothetical protein